MYFDFKVKIPEEKGKIFERTIKGVIYFPDAELPVDEGRNNRSSCLRVGTYLVIEKILMDV